MAGDQQRKADADKAIEAASTKLWTPGQKHPERVKQLALMFFMEVVKANTTNRKVATSEVWEGFYREALDLAKMVHRIENEDVPRP